MRGAGGTVGDCVELAIAKIHALHFLQIERARTAASEHRHLIAALIHSAIAIDALGDGQRRSTRAMSGNQFGNGARAESGKVGIVGGRKQLKHAQPVLAIGHIGKQLRRDHAEFDIVHVIHGAVGVENLVQPGLLGMLDIHHRQTLLAGTKHRRRCVRRRRCERREV